MRLGHNMQGLGQDQLGLCCSEFRIRGSGSREVARNKREHPKSRGQAAASLAHIVLGVVVQLFLVMVAVASAKEPLIAGCAAIRVLKHHKVAEPIFDAASFRTKEFFATTIRATGGLRSSFLHGKSSAGGIYVTTSGGPNRSGSLASKNNGAARGRHLFTLRFHSAHNGYPSVSRRR